MYAINNACLIAGSVGAGSVNNGKFNIHNCKANYTNVNVNK